MNKVRKFLVIFVIVLNLYATIVENVQIDCEFKSGDYYIKTKTWTNKYFCWINSKAVIQLENKDGNNNSNVELVHFNSQKDTEYFATFRKLKEIFSNLHYLYIYLSNLTGISNQDLKHFPDLQYITINGCEVSSLPSSLFQFNKKLKFIRIEHNKILSLIGQNIFNNLPNLQSVKFGENKCLNETINCEGRPQIDELSARFSSSCFSYLYDQLNTLIERQEENLAEKLNKSTKNLQDKGADHKKLVVEILDSFSDHHKNYTEKITNLERVDDYLRGGIDKIGENQSFQRISVTQQKTDIDDFKKSFNDNLKSLENQNKEVSEKIVHQGNINYEVQEKIKELKNDLKQNFEADAVVKHNLENIQQSKDKTIEELKSHNEELRTTIKELKSNIKTLENKLLDQERTSASLWEKIREISEKIKNQDETNQEKQR